MTRYTSLVRVLIIAVILIAVVGAGAAMAGHMSEEEAVLIFGIGGSIFGCLQLIVGGILAWWMAKDAAAKGQSPVLWGLLGFFLTWIGLIIWLITRPKT